MNVRNIESPLFSKYLDKDIFYAINQKVICRL